MKLKYWLLSQFFQDHVYLCDFHCEQRWERWVKDHKHGLTKDGGESLLDLLRTCANASPPPAHGGKQQDHYYQQALANLKANKVWKENTRMALKYMAIYSTDIILAYELCMFVY